MFSYVIVILLQLKLLTRLAFLTAFALSWVKHYLFRSSQLMESQLPIFDSTKHFVIANSLGASKYYLSSKYFVKVYYYQLSIKFMRKNFNSFQPIALYYHLPCFLAVIAIYDLLTFVFKSIIINGKFAIMELIVVPIAIDYYAVKHPTAKLFTFLNVLLTYYNLSFPTKFAIEFGFECSLALYSKIVAELVVSKSMNYFDSYCFRLVRAIPKTIVETTISSTRTESY